MIKEYERYTINPSLDRAEALLEAIKRYDPSQYASDIEHIKPLHQKCQGVSEGWDMRSNGSTLDHSTYYKFGPNFHFWHERLNQLIRFPYGNQDYKSVLVYNVPVDSFFFKVYAREEDDGYFQKSDMYPVDYTLLANYHQRSAIDYYIKFFSDTPHKKLYIWGRPDQHLPLFCNKDVVEAMKGKVCQIHSSWYEAFFPYEQDIYVNDNMLSWKSGLYFYSCKHNQRHFMPLFYQHGGCTYNILNLMTPLVSDDSDDIKVHGTVTCKCGVKRLDMEFVSHYKNAVRDANGKVIGKEFAQQLKGYYSYLQVIQDQDRVLVSSSSISEIEKDLKLFQDTFANQSLEFVRDKVCRVGDNKWPNLWYKQNATENLTKLKYKNNISFI
jgi:hypothetical protein